MAKIPLTGQTVSMLSDGYVGKILDKALEEVGRDLADRGHDGKKRKIVLTISFALDGAQIGIDAQAKTTLPSHKPPVTIAKFDNHAGGLVFNPEVSNSPDQQTFSDAEAE